MRIARNLINVQRFEDGCVATIGNFDGVHRGHRMIIDQLAEYGQTLKLPTVVVIFEPHPLELLKPERAPARLSRLREKLALLQQLPVDQVMVLRFDAKLANLSAEDFVCKYLIDGLNIQRLVIGDDFQFGRQRQGNFELLKRLGSQYNFDVINNQTLLDNDRRISSTAVRQALHNGDLQAASQLLGRPYAICGRVVKGDGRGRELGYPTANIRLSRNSIALKGVFAVNATLESGMTVPGVANIGVRPTVDNNNRIASLEVHLFDMDQNLYGQYLQVEFQSQLRDERKFDSLQELTRQIKTDTEQARSVLNV
ncbi:MAG: bifunctional riboflavin kinase/FAD synthetase [Gammaproteobacteria bacterium]|nr:bifunctional riboflavin kinase/FAD synthetase [Gammaproteobacteria bacterium]